MTRIRKWPPELTAAEYNGLIDDYFSQTDTNPQKISSDEIESGLLFPYSAIVHKPDSEVEYYEAYKNIGRKYTRIGGGSDASTVIQSAIDALTSGRTGLEWVVLKGNFIINDIVYVDSYTGIDAKGAYLKLGADIDAIFENKDYETGRSSYVYFLGGIYEGDKATRTKGSAIKGTFTHSDFDSLTIIKFKEYGIHTFGVTGSFHANANRYHFVTIGLGLPALGCDGGGLYLDSTNDTGSPDCYISNCIFINNGNFAVKMSRYTWVVKFVNCHFTMGGTNGKGIYATEDVRKVGIFNCEFEFSDREAILVDPAAWGSCDEWKIIGNTFANCSKEANNTYSVINFKVTGPSGFGIIRDNTFVSDQANKAKYAIELSSGVSYFTVESNKIESNAYATGAIYPAGTGNIYKDNYGFVTENSGTSTGTGEQQTIPHGLNVIPNRLQLSDLEAGADPYQSAAADIDNIYVTAVLDKDYLWKVWKE